MQKKYSFNLIIVIIAVVFVGCKSKNIEAIPGIRIEPYNENRHYDFGDYKYVILFAPKPADQKAHRVDFIVGSHDLAGKSYGGDWEVMEDACYLFPSATGEADVAYNVYDSAQNITVRDSIHITYTNHCP